MSTCGMCNPGLSGDIEERIKTIRSICDAAQVHYTDTYLTLWREELIVKCKELRGEPVVLFVHGTDIGSVAEFAQGIDSWPTSLFAIFYSGRPEGVRDEPPTNNGRIKCLRASYPAGVKEHSGRFALLVRAVDAAKAANVQAFRTININAPIIPRIVRIWEDLDLILQATIRLGHIPEDALSHVKVALKAEPTDYLGDNGLKEKYFDKMETGKTMAIHDLLYVDKQPSPLLRIHSALASGGELPFSPTDNIERLKEAHGCFVRIRKCLCESIES